MVNRLKICVVGPQCVGKSTLIDDIINEFPQFTKPAFTYRDAIKSSGIENKINDSTCIESQQIIFNAIKDEIQSSDNYTIHDRSILDAIAYSIWPTLYNADNTDITKEFIEKLYDDAMSVLDEIDLLIYIPVDNSIPLPNRALRNTDIEYRNQMSEIFDDLLICNMSTSEFYKYGYKVAIIEGSRSKRIATFKKIVSTLV